MPIIAIPRIVLNVLSLLILGSAVYLLWSWGQGYDVRDADGVLRHSRGPAWRLYLGGFLLAWSFLGRFVVLALLPPGKDEPREERGRPVAVTGPDHTELRVDAFGRTGGDAVVLTHGWGLNSTAWWYTRRALEARFRVVTWDLPGLGKSKTPKDGRLTVDRFAQCLGAVVESTQAERVVLVGHSIGGMTTESFWRACPEALRRRVAGVVLVDTTYRNPLDTMWLAPLWRALRWPVIEPLCWLTILLFPLAWLASWQGYLSGFNQLAMRLTGFGRYATRGQVDFTARLACKGSPGVQAKGNLAMFRWEASSVLPSIGVPVLVLTGGKDIVTLPDASRTIAGAIANARLAPMEGAGHMGLLEKHEAYNREIEAFAAEVLRPAA